MTANPIEHKLSVKMSPKVIPNRPYPDLLTWRTAGERNQREAARFLGMSQATYSRLERRARFLKGTRARHVMQKTGVPLEVIVGADR